MNLEQVYTYLESLSIAVLATSSKDGKPYTSPIYFVPDHYLNFFFIAKSDTKKARDLQQNANASLTIVDPNQPKTVQTTGRVSKVNDPQLYSYVLKKMSENVSQKNKFYWPPPISKIKSVGNLIMYKFQPDWLRVGDFTKTTPEEINTGIFYQIIPQDNNS